MIDPLTELRATRDGSSGTGERPAGRSVAVAPGVEPLIPVALLELLHETVIVVDARGRVVQAAMPSETLATIAPLPTPIDDVLLAYPCIVEGRLLAREEMPVVRAMAGETCRLELVVAAGPMAGVAMAVSAAPIWSGAAVTGAMLVVDVGHDDSHFAKVRAPLRSVFDHAPIGLMILTPEGDFIRANPAATEMFGYSADELLERRFVDITHPNDVETFRDLAADMKGGRIPSFETEKRYLRADGTTMWGRVTATAVAPLGTVAYVVATVQDITREREVEEALQQSRDRLAAVVDASPIAIFGFDLNGTVQALEGAIVSDADRRQLLGESIVALSPEPELTDAVAAVLQGGEAVVEGAYDGEHYQCHLRPVRDGAGEVLGGVLVAINQTEVFEARLELERSERRFRALSERASDLAIICDERAIMSYVAPASLGVLGYDHREVEQMSGWDFIHPEDVPHLDVAFQRALAGPGAHPPIEFRARHKDGTYRWVEERFTNLFSDPDIGGMVVNLRDIHEARSVREALVASEQRYRSIVEGAHEGILVVTAEGVVTMCNGRMAELLGAPRKELVGTKLTTHVVGDASGFMAAGGVDRPNEREEVLLRADGSLVHALVSSHVLRGPDGDVQATANMVIDVGERKRHEAELERLASYDHLTGLPNRRSFGERLRNVLEAGARPAVVFIDLDDFKAINDSFGHVVGDEVLRAVGAMLDAVLDDRGFLARFSGDEFVACLPTCPTHEDALAIVEEMAAALRMPFVAGGREVYVTLGAGIAGTAAAPPADADALLAFADAALNRAKRTGRGSRRLYDAAVSEEVRRRVAIGAAMRRGLERGLFHAAFQPIVDVGTGETVGAEALCRWTDPELGTMNPAEFIPIAEQNGLINEITARIIDDACRAAVGWREKNPERPLRVSVNVSGVELADPAIVGTVASALDASGLEPGLLCLEVTESVLMTDADASVIALRSLKALGVKLAVDDFGTGYSSLSYLKRFPLDQLKIDRSFTKGLGVDLEDSAIVEAIVRLADVLGLDVVAEGVETSPQREALAALGCRYGQGWLWAAAGAAEEVLVTAAPVQELIDVAPDPDRGLAEMAAEQNPPTDLGEAAAVLAHELRSPLTIIRGFSEVLSMTLDAAGDSAALRHAQAIAHAAERLERTVEILADLRRIDRGTVELRRELLDLRHVVEASTARLGDRLGEHQVDIVGDDIFVSADPAAVDQILTNLFTNVAKYTPVGTRVDVLLEKRGREARVVIADDGPGIPVDQLDAIFRKFGRLDRTRSGVGIGLYISRGLARAHGGDLRARRSAVGGAEFELLLPLPHHPAPR